MLWYQQTVSSLEFEPTEVAVGCLSTEYLDNEASIRWTKALASVEISCFFFSPMWGFQWKPATGEILPPPSQIITAYFPFKFQLSHHCCYLINNYWYWIWSQNVGNGISGLLDSKIFGGACLQTPLGRGALWPCKCYSCLLQNLLKPLLCI